MSETTSDLADPNSSLGAQRSNLGASMVSRLRALGFRGGVVEDSEDLSRYARDYGRRVSALPRLVVLPHDTADVQKAFTAAAEAELPVRLRGEGNALAGQSQTQGGLIIATRDLRLESGATIEINKSRDGGPSARLSTGLSWGEATMRLAEAGYRVAVAVLCREPSVGGTLSAGGIGLGSHALGAQIDSVLDAEIVTPDACVVSTKAQGVGASEHPALGGHGQFGLITSVTVPLVPIGESLLLERYAFSNFADLAAALHENAAVGSRIIGLWGAVNRMSKTGRLQYQVNIVRDRRWTRESAPSVSEARSSQSVSIPWAEFTRAAPADWQPTRFPAWAETTFRNHDDMAAFVDRHPAIFDDLRPGDIISCIPVRRRSRSTTTVSRWPDVLEGSLMASMGLFMFRDSLIDAERLTSWQYSLHSNAARAFGATNYAISCLPRSAQEWGEHLGAARSDVEETRKRLDPSGVVAPFLCWGRAS